MGTLGSSTSTTHWQGDLMSGSGRTSMDTSGLQTFDVAWSKRTTPESGTTNPEELLAAAYSTCYSMALSNKLAQGGHPPTSLETSVTVTFEVGDDGAKVSKIVIAVKGEVPGLSDAEFAAEAEWAKTNCPIGAALGAVTDKTVTVG